MFTSIAINKLILPNRIIRSATHEALANPEGLYTNAIAETYEQLAQNNVGLIITGHAAVSPEGLAGRNQATAFEDECIEYWRPVIERVHQAGGKIVLQLAHAGCAAADAKTAMGPSRFSSNSKRTPCREMTKIDIIHLRKKFKAAALRAQEAGFDGVQIHAGHGYLLSEFLSPYYNWRTDEYGGNLKNRSRLLLEIVRGIRGAVGKNYPILCKINSDDFVEDGFSSDECIQVCAWLELNGIDAVELSGGIPQEGPGTIRLRESEPYYTETSRQVKNVIKIPVILVGGIRKPQTIVQYMAENVCDAVALSRPLIREPDLVARWQKGDPRKSECISCNACFRPVVVGKGFYCPLNLKNR